MGKWRIALTGRSGFGVMGYELAAAPQGFNAIYARHTTAPRRDGLRPRGCLLVLAKHSVFERELR